MKTREAFVLDNIGGILDVIKKEGSIWKACAAFNIKQATLVKYLNKYGGDYRSFLRNRSHVATRTKATDYFSNERMIAPNRLRDKLIAEGIKQPRCEWCGRSKWGRHPIPLELHHIDFNRYNNSLDNVAVICANCHRVAHGFCNTYTEDEARVARKKLEKLGKIKEQTHNNCPICGIEIASGSKRCKHCEGLVRRNKNKLTASDVILAVKELGSFTRAANKFGKSANALVKFLRVRGFPYHTKEVLKYESHQLAPFERTQR